MLHDLHDELASCHVTFCIVGAHAQLRALLRAEGLADKTDSGEWLRTLDSVLDEGKVRGRSGLHQERPSGPRATVRFTRIEPEAPADNRPPPDIPHAYCIASAAFAAAWRAGFER